MNKTSPRRGKKPVRRPVVPKETTTAKVKAAATVKGVAAVVEPANGAISRYDAMVQAIEACAAIDEVQEFRNEAAAMEEYARRSRNFEAEMKAAEIRQRATRKLGELMRHQKEAGLLATGGRPKIRSKTDPILAKPNRLGRTISTELFDALLRKGAWWTGFLA